jgi:hypothetical protein
LAEKLLAYLQISADPASVFRRHIIVPQWLDQHIKGSIRICRFEMVCAQALYKFLSAHALRFCVGHIKPPFKIAAETTKNPATAL